MSDLTDFLLARIAEDEAVANSANSGARWESWNRSWDTEPQRDIAAGGVRLFAVPTMYDEHIARHDPARVLAECEAKRRIVERHDVVDAAGGCAFCGEPAPCEHLRILTLPHSDHPDYRDEWRP